MEAGFLTTLSSTSWMLQLLQVVEGVLGDTAAMMHLPVGSAHSHTPVQHHMTITCHSTLLHHILTSIGFIM